MPMTKLMRRIEEVLHNPGSLNPEHEQQWSEDALGVLLPGSKKEIRQLASAGIKLLEDFAYQDTANAAKKSHTSKKRFETMCFHRKVLMIGRDTLDLVTETKLTNTSELKPIPDFIRTLGGVADVKGHDKQLRNRAVAEASYAETASQLICDMPTNLRSPSRLESRCRRLANTDFLDAGLSGEIEISEDEYHRRRRAFRAVVHLGFLSYVVEPDDEKLAYVERGFELNRTYGACHNGILASDGSAVNDELLVANL